jgi:hypothetical protein
VIGKSHKEVGMIITFKDNRCPFCDQELAPNPEDRGYFCTRWRGWPQHYINRYVTDGKLYICNDMNCPSRKSTDSKSLLEILEPR